MQIEEIEVTIDQDGQVHIHVSGVKGEACLELTQALEAALGGEVEERQMTSEALEPAPNRVQTRRQQHAG
ncbi:MAG: DUF2997 domain-containing protein [Chloroflexota bacterium]